MHFINVTSLLLLLITTIATISHSAVINKTHNEVEHNENTTTVNDYYKPKHDHLYKNDYYPYVRHLENKRHRVKDNYDKSLLDLDLKYCPRPAKCVILNYTTCMGAKLPYDSTSLALTDLTTQEDVQEKLSMYAYLKFIPKCWAVIQPFLCALYMPKCENDMVDLPSKEMCKITMGPCKILYNTTTIFPDFMRCEDEQLFPSHCKNDIHELKFNTTGFCMEPLVKTDHPDWFYHDIEGCGLRCKDSFYTENEQYQIHKLVAYCVLLCITLNLFTIVTFMIDYKTANKYPALAIFYINICFFVSYSGWLVQFLGYETREDVVCKKDGTLRKSEPSATENLSCVIVFVMVYYFLIAGMVWFVIFAYCWYMSSLQALGKIQERVDKKKAYFHLVAWSLPLMLTITTMALGEIDGDYVTGICFVGFVNSAARLGLLLTPLAAAILVAGYIIIRGLILLIRVKIESREIISEHSSQKIRSNIVRMGVFALFMLVFCVITFFYHGYRAINAANWELSLYNYILCKLTSLSNDYSYCRQESRPSVAMLQLQLIAVFASGVAMASWIWCGATVHSWSRYIRRKFHCEIDEPIKLQKHKIIAEAFAKRKKFNAGGRISIECQNHTDPVGLHFDLNSAASNDMSTTWAANLPRLVSRRGAVPNEITCSVSSNNHSVDSEMSYSVRHVSIESRRNSGDSQLSVQIAELKATRKVNGRRHRSNNRYRRKHDFRRGSRDINGLNKKLSKTGSKRESSTSLDSHFGQQLLNVLEVKKFAPNMNRRAGNAGLDSQHINNLLSNGKLVIPYLKSGSEDENVSVTISESKFNMVVTNTNNMDLNDELVMKSLRQGLQIEEIGGSSCSSSEDDHQRSNRNVKIRSVIDSDSDNGNKNEMCSSNSSYPELKHLVQSSLNSGTSVGCYEKNRASKQSKTSIDVAVQANAKEIMTQTGNYEMANLDKDKETRKSLKSRKGKYKNGKNGKSRADNDDKKNGDYESETENLINDNNKYKAKIRTTKT